MVSKIGLSVEDGGRWGCRVWLEVVLPASRGLLLLGQESSDSGASNSRIAPFSPSLPPSISLSMMAVIKNFRPFVLFNEHSPFYFYCTNQS